MIKYGSIGPIKLKLDLYLASNLFLFSLDGVLDIVENNLRMAAGVTSCVLPMETAVHCTSQIVVRYVHSD